MVNGHRESHLKEARFETEVKINHSLTKVHHRGFVNLDTIDSNALSKVENMWRSKQADFLVVFGQYGTHVRTS